MAADRSSLPRVGPDPAFVFPAIQRHVLDGGLRVWTVEHRGVPLVTWLLLVPAGAAADPGHLPGLAALTGDLLDEGAGDRDALELSDALAHTGSQLDIEVGPDATVVGLTGLTRCCDRALPLLADIAVRPRFDPARPGTNQGSAAEPAAPAQQSAAGARRPGLHRVVVSEPPIRPSADWDSPRTQERRPRRCTNVPLAVLSGGHRHPHRRRRRAARTTRGLGGGGVSRLVDAGGRHTIAHQSPRASATDDGERAVFVSRPAAAQSELRVGHVAVARDTPDYHALLILNMVLGGQFVSRLNLKLREEKGFTYGARSAFDFRCEPGPFVVQVSVQSNATGERLATSWQRSPISGDRGRPPMTKCD